MCSPRDAHLSGSPDPSRGSEFHAATSLKYEINPSHASLINNACPPTLSTSTAVTPQSRRFGYMGEESGLDESATDSPTLPIPDPQPSVSCMLPDTRAGPAILLPQLPVPSGGLYSENIFSETPLMTPIPKTRTEGTPSSNLSTPKCRLPGLEDSDLCALFKVIKSPKWSQYLVDGRLEPIHGSPEAEEILFQTGRRILVRNHQAGESIYTSFILDKTCLPCCRHHNAKDRALECVRRHLGHRPFRCTSDECTTSSCSPRR